MGDLLLIVGLLLLVIGTASYFRLKRLTAAPFHKTGAIAKDASLANARGLIATEGAITPVEIVRAPCCGQSSVAYEVTVDREWEKPAPADGKGRPERGKTRIVTHRGGALFTLDDGSGPMTVDAREGVKAELLKSLDERVTVGMVVPGEIVFGNMRMQTPVGLAQDRTLAFHAVEKILPAQGRLYVCGKLAGGVIARPGWTSLVLSQRGYSAMKGGSRAMAFAGLVVGTLCTVGSIPLLLTTTPPSTAPAPDAGAPLEGPSAAPRADSVPAPESSASAPPAASDEPPIPAPAPAPAPHSGGRGRPRRVRR